MQVYSVDTLTDCRCLPFMSASPPACVHPNFEDRVVLVRGCPHQHSRVWVVHCWSSEMQPSERLSHHLLSALHTQLEAELTGAKLPSSDIIIWKLLKKPQWITVTSDLPYIDSAVFVSTSDDKFHLIHPQPKSSIQYSERDGVYPQSRCKDGVDADAGPCFVVFWLSYRFRLNMMHFYLNGYQTCRHKTVSLAF